MTELTPDYQATMGRLAALSRNHLLFFRLEVGRLLLEDFFGGEAEAYQSQDPKKAGGSFYGFVESCGEELREIGLGEQVLRQCIQAHIAVRALPVGTVERLLFSHIVELARVGDGATRSVLAQAAVENQWSSRQLRDAAQAAAAGKWIDGDPSPGLQPVAPEEEEKIPQLGRVVSRFERSAEDLDALSSQWEQVASKKLTGAQKLRVKEAIGRLRARLEEMEGRLG
ncbi:MAG TPA: hypothetical protein PKW90_00735 [Myxococcota bacterium]|nr:hypothetical protein [Myxococcota bacterium]